MEHRVDPSFLELCAFSFFSALKGALPPSDVAKNLTGIYHSTPACKNCERYASELHISLKVALAVTEAEQKTNTEIFFANSKLYSIIQPETYLQRVSKTADHLRFKLSGEETEKKLDAFLAKRVFRHLCEIRKGKRAEKEKKGTCGIIYNG